MSTARPTKCHDAGLLLLWWSLSLVLFQEVEVLDFRAAPPSTPATLHTFNPVFQAQSNPPAFASVSATVW